MCCSTIVFYDERECRLASGVEIESVNTIGLGTEAAYALCIAHTRAPVFSFDSILRCVGLLNRAERECDLTRSPQKEEHELQN
jgi:hypothetical protein